MLVSLLLTPLVILWSGSRYGVDMPDAFRKKHRAPVPRLGGIPLFIVFVLSWLVTLLLCKHTHSQQFALLISSTLIFFLGLVDDFKPLGAKVKLLGQIGVAVLAFSLGLKIELVTWPVGNFGLDVGAWSMPLTVFWLVAIPNLVNLIDGIDGLAGGLGIFLFTTLGFVGWMGGQMPVIWLSLAMAGGLSGFLCYNFPPARIFLGDGGAYLVGFGIAALSLSSSNKGTIAAALLVTTVGLGLPILDAIFALLRRALRGFPVFRADAEHIHHRLVGLGLSDRRIVMGMYLVTLVLSLIGLSVLWTQGRSLPMAVGLAFILAIFAARYLGYVWTWADLKSQIQRALGRREDVKYILLLARVLEVEVERCETMEEFRAALEYFLRKAGFGLEAGAAAGGAYAMVLDVRGGPGLQLYIHSSGHDRHYWKRMADCFRPACMKACKRWGDAWYQPDKK